MKKKRKMRRQSLRDGLLWIPITVGFANVGSLVMDVNS